MPGAAVAPFVKNSPPAVSSLELQRATRLALWLLVFFLELSNATLLALCAAMYYRHDTRGAFLWVIKVYILFRDGYQFLETSGYIIASGYAILSVAFLYRVVLVIYTSLRHRELRFGLTTTKTPAGPLVHDTRELPSTCTSRIWSWWGWLRESVGIHGPYFEMRQLVDELVELVAQIYSARTSSESISSVALNQIYGVVILLNCISTPVFQLIYSRREDLIKQRVARLLTDLVLDFVWGTLLPFWMYKPLRRQYWNQKDHADAVDTSQNSTREVERVLILSWWSFLLSVIPFCNSLLTLIEVRALLREEVVSATATSARRTRSLVRLVMSDASMGVIKSPPGRRRLRHLLRVAHPYLYHGLHVFIAIVGIATFLISVSASGIFGFQPHETSYDCVHRVHPWFATREACIGRSIDCATLGVQGSSGDVDAALRVFDAHSLTDLSIANCPALSLSTPWIQRFARLQMLQISNSSIVSWDEETSALRAERFPDMKTIKLINVTLDVPPHTIALFTTPLSHSVEWVYITDTNMNEALLLEEIVATNWQHLIYFDCARCQLQAFPTTVVQSMEHLIMLSVIGNNISSIPNTWPQRGAQLVMVWLDGNTQLRELPDTLWCQGGSSLVSVYVQQTSLASLPSWVPETVLPNKEFMLYAHASPLCSEGSDGLPGFVSCEDQEL